MPSERNEVYVTSNVPSMHSKLVSLTKRQQMWYSALNVYSFMNKKGQYKCQDIRNLQKTAVANVKESERSN